MSTSKQGEMQVVAGIIWRDGKFLGVERPQGMPYAGWWEFPGGKMEPGESYEQALARELEEELGVTPLASTRFLDKAHAYEQFTVRVHFYHVTDFNGEPKPLEGQTLQWFTPGEADVDVFLEADREALEKLGETV